jgi:hypothetical protein
VISEDGEIAVEEEADGSQRSEVGGQRSDVWVEEWIYAVEERTGAL